MVTCWDFNDYNVVTRTISIIIDVKNVFTFFTRFLKFCRLAGF